MEKKQITLQIDRHYITVPEGATILEAARKIGIDIPTLCHIDLKGTCIKNNPASCRICVVEVEGRRNLAPACATRCTEGMVVRTSTLRVMNARKVVAELILSDHPNDCLTCPKCGNCELQTLALRFNIRTMPFNGGELSPRKREVTSSIVRNMDKCIFCRRCESVCNDVQTVGALGAIRRGFNTTIAPAFDKMMTDSECTYCGQCVAVCPVGALTETDNTQDVWKALADPAKHVVVQPAPAVRAALGEEFGLPMGTSVTGKMAAALRRLGFAKVFDTDFGADLTIMEEGTELIDRLNNGGVLPMITSCSPGWIKYCEHYYPEFIPNLSSCKSPHEMTGAMVKTYYADKAGIDPQNIVVVSVMPCTAKKYEIQRPELSSLDGVPDVDAVLTTRELARMIKSSGIDLRALPEGPFDHVLCMGPLYHLLKEEERKTAIANCLSRLRPGGVFFAAFISMYSDLLYRLGHMADWPEGIAEVDGNEVNRRYYGCLERGEDYAGEAFTRAYFAQAGSAERHFEGFPLKKLHLVGSEGVLASREGFKNLPAEARAGWIELSLRLCEIPELLSWSEHLLYIGQKIQEDRI